MKAKYLLTMFALSAIGCSEFTDGPVATEPEFEWSYAEEGAEPEADNTQPLERAKSNQGKADNLGNGGQDEADAPEPIDPAQFEAEVIEWVNEIRSSGADCGENGSFAPAQPMRANNPLRAAARRHSEDMAAHDMMSHEGSDGTRFWNRADDAGYRGASRGENVAVGYPEPEEVVRAWLESDGHCMVLMLPETNEIGVGYNFRDHTRYGHFWTMVTGIR